MVVTINARIYRIHMFCSRQHNSLTGLANQNGVRAAQVIWNMIGIIRLGNTILFCYFELYITNNDVNAQIHMKTSRNMIYCSWHEWNSTIRKNYYSGKYTKCYEL